MVDPEGGQRVKRLVLEAMAARHIPSIVQLSERADVGRDTLNAWFRGREPGPDAGAKVAETLGISYRDLMDAFRGAPQVTQTPDALVSALLAQTEAISALVAKLDELGEARSRADAAESALLELPANEARRERSAHRGTKG